MDKNNIITRKEALYVISRYLKFIPKILRLDCLKEMIRLKLLKIVNRDKLKVINPKKSQSIRYGIEGEDKK